MAPSLMQFIGSPALKNKKISYDYDHDIEELDSPIKLFAVTIIQLTNKSALVIL
jgi:hypothetical protein